MSLQIDWLLHDFDLAILGNTLTELWEGQQALQTDVEKLKDAPLPSSDLQEQIMNLRATIEYEKKRIDSIRDWQRRTHTTLEKLRLALLGIKPGRRG